MATKKNFAFALAQPVKVRLSAESGTVIGRAQFLRSNPSYYVEYVAADGRQAQSWFDEESLVPAQDTAQPQSEIEGRATGTEAEPESAA